MKRSGSDGVAGHFFLTAKSRFHAGFSVMLKCLLAFGSVSTAFELAAAAKKADLWLDHPHYKLPGASSKGHSFAAAMGKSKNKTWLSSIDPTKYPLPGKRPVPTADFMAKDMPGKKGNVKFQKVRVELLEEAGVFRDAAVSFGFPLPQGALFDLAQIRLTDGKNPLDASFSITGKYADNSIRWVMIRTRMPLAAKEKKYVFVEFGSSLAPRKNLAKPVTVQTKGDNFIINNGAISAAINQKRFTFVNNIAAKGRYLGGVNAFGALLILKDGKRMGSYKLVPRSVKLIESTPQIVTFRIDGDFWDVKQPFASYSARISFRQGVPGFDVEYSFVNTNLRYEFLDIKSLTIGFCTGKPARNKIVSWQHFKGDAAVPANAKRVVQLDDKTLAVDGKNINARIPGGIKFTMADGMEGIITIADAWKRYPKGFSVEQEKNTVQIELLPVLPDEKFGKHLPFYLQFPFCGGAHRMKWGTSFTEKISFRFGRNLSADAAAAEADLPVIAIVEPSWYARAGIWKGMKKLVFTSGIDHEALEIFKRNLQRREEHREYGAFNYGDSFGERKMQNWTNNEYDMAHGMFMLGLRTGNRDVLRYAAAAALHEANVDVVHAYVLPYFVGCNIQHSCAHTGTYGKWSWPYRAGFNDGHSGHYWLRGMVDSWHLFGTGVSMDGAYLVADHLQFAWLPGLDKLVQIRDGAWNLIALCEIAKSTGDPEYRKGADKLAKYLMDLIDTKTHWYLNRTGNKARGGAGIATFMCGIILNSLCDYYDLTQRKDVAEECADFARWILREAYAPEFSGLFWYDITTLGRSHFASEFLNALLAPGIIRAGAISGDRKLYAAGLNAFQALAMRYVPNDGKSVALHLLFLEEVFQASAVYGVKDPAALPRTYDRSQWRSGLAKNQDGSLMSRGKSRFVMKSGKENAVAKIMWSNYNAACGKTVIKRLTVKDAAGKVVLEQKNIKPQTMVQYFTFKLGTPGSSFFIDIDCDSRSLWVIPGSKDYTAYHDSSIQIPFVSLVSGRFELEQLAGETINLKFTPLHMGNYGIKVLTADGTLLFEQKGFKSETKLSGNQKRVNITVPAAKQKRTLVLELFAGNCATLDCQPAKLISRPGK